MAVAAERNRSRRRVAGPGFINTGTTIVTFLMVFLIQRTQNKDGLALQLKLNELREHAGREQPAASHSVEETESRHAAKDCR